MTRLAPGMTLYLEGGTYYERLQTKVDGTTTQPITITSYNGTAVLDGSQQNWAVGANQNLAMLELRKNNYIVQNIKVVNSKNTGILLGANNLTVTGCEVAFSQRHAISTDTNFQLSAGANTNIRNVTLEGNNVHDNVLLGQGYGQAISLIADGFLVKNNNVWNNRTEGIDIWLSASHGEVIGNTVTGNGSAGIFVDGAAYVRIDGNSVFNNGRGIGVSSEDPRYATHDIWVYNNVIANNTGAGLFLWDDLAHPGYRGVQKVLWAYNTLVNNSTNMYLFGDSNSLEIAYNLLSTPGTNYWSDATNTSANLHDNVYLTDLSGFVSPPGNNYRLKSSQVGLILNASLVTFRDDRGGVFSIGTDMVGADRLLNLTTNAGAYQF